MQISIQELLQKQTKELGQKWLEATQDPVKLAKMVDTIADHLSESMKLAYQNGLEERNKLAILTIK